MSLFLTPLILWAASLSMGYALISPLGVGPGLRRTALAALVGLAAVVLVLSWVNAFHSITPLHYYLLAACLAAPWWRRASREALRRDLRIVVTDYRSWIFTTLCLPILLLLNLANGDASGGRLSEWGLNHDVLHWVVAANALQEHPYLPIPAETTGGQHIFRQFAGWWAWDARLGVESVLAWTSKLLDRDAQEIYHAFALSFVPLWMLGSLLLVAQMGRRRLAGLTLVVAMLAQPVMIRMLNQGHLPNFVGIILGAGLATLVVAYLRDREPQHRWPHIMLGGLMTNALLATYPEFAPVLALPLAGLVAAKAWRQWDFSPLFFGFALVGVAALLNPIVLIRGVSTVWEKSGAPEVSRSMPGVLDGLSPTHWAAALLTGERDWVATMPTVIAILFLLVFAAAFAAGVKMAYERQIAFVGSAILLLLLGSAWLTDFPYATTKAAYNAHLFLGAVVLCGANALWLDHGRDRKRRLLLAALAAWFAILGGSSVHQWQWGQRVARSKSIPHALLPAARDFARQHPAAGLRIFDQSFPRPFFFSAWLPYVFRETVTSFPHAPDQARWYHQPWPVAAVASASPRYIVTSSDPAERLFVLLAPPVREIGPLRLYEASLGEISSAGILLRRDDALPIARDGFRLEVAHGVGWCVELALRVSEHSAEPGHELAATVNGQPVTLSPRDGGLVLTVPLGPESTLVEFAPAADTKGDYSITMLAFDRFPAPFLATATGLHDREGYFRWMGRTALLDPASDASGWLNLQIVGRYHGIASDASLRITSGSTSWILSESELRAGISLPIEPNGEEWIEVKSLAGAVSPVSLGESSDDRELSFAFAVLNLTADPWFESTPLL